MLREPLAIPLREARPPLVLALDIGTSGLRVFLFDARGRPIVRCIAHADAPVRASADGEVTVDAEERVRAACRAIDAVLEIAGRRAGEIAAMGTSTFWHSLLGVDAHGRPTTRVVTWADTRARGAVASPTPRICPRSCGGSASAMRMHMPARSGGCRLGSTCICGSSARVRRDTAWRRPPGYTTSAPAAGIAHCCRIWSSARRRSRRSTTRRSRGSSRPSSGAGPLSRARRGCTARLRVGVERQRQLEEAVAPLVS